MNKEYALQILETVEVGTLEHDCSLANEAYNYLNNLILRKKKVLFSDDEILDRIYNAKHKRQW